MVFTPVENTNTRRTVCSEDGRVMIDAYFIDKYNSKIKVDISCDYGDYWFDGMLKNNKGSGSIIVNSGNLSYGITAGKRYFSKYF